MFDSPIEQLDVRAGVAGDSVRVLVRWEEGPPLVPIGHPGSHARTSPFAERRRQHANAAGIRVRIGFKVRFGFGFRVRGRGRLL